MLQQAITIMFETQEGENPGKEVEAIFKKDDCFRLLVREFQHVSHLSVDIC